MPWSASTSLLWLPLCSSRGCGHVTSGEGPPWSGGTCRMWGSPAGRRWMCTAQEGMLMYLRVRAPRNLASRHLRKVPTYLPTKHTVEGPRSGSGAWRRKVPFCGCSRTTVTFWKRREEEKRQPGSLSALWTGSESSAASQATCLGKCIKYMLVMYFLCP